MTVNGNLAIKIRELREKSGLNQTALGELCGWSQQNQSEIEAGRCQISVAQVYLVAEALEVELGELLPDPRAGEQRGLGAEGQGGE